MHRAFFLTIVALAGVGCGSNAASADRDSTDLETTEARETSGTEAVTSAEPAGPRGMPLESSEDLCAALDELAEAWEMQESPPDDVAALVPRAILRLDSEGAACSAAVVRGDACTDGATCDADLSRCVVGSKALLTRQGSEGRYLHAVISYYPEEVPEEEPAELERRLEQRDRSCALYEMVHTGEVTVDPEGYVRTGVNEGDSRTYTGEEAIAMARQDAESFAGPWLECTETECVWNYASNGAELMGQLRAERGEDGQLYLTGRRNMGSFGE